MTPLSLLVAGRARGAARRDLLGGTTVLAARPAGVLHVYTGPLTPSGRCVPRAARTVCKTRTRTLRVVSLDRVGRRRVCAHCRARLASPVSEAGHPTRASLLEAYAGVTPFDLAMDAWRAETVADVERVELLALLLVGYPACKKSPVVGPDGHENDPLVVWTARARARVGATRDYLTPGMRATAQENELLARHAAKQRRHDAWRDREDRIERLGFVNATA